MLINVGLHFTAHHQGWLRLSIPGPQPHRLLGAGLGGYLHLRACSCYRFPVAVLLCVLVVFYCYRLVALLADRVTAHLVAVVRVPLTLHLVFCCEKS